jgi:hypothetical protein
VRATSTLGRRRLYNARYGWLATDCCSEEDFTTANDYAALEQRAREWYVDTVLPKAVLFEQLEGVARSILRLDEG